MWKAGYAYEPLEGNMKKLSVLFAVVGLGLVVLAGCVSTVPMSSNINDFVMMGIKTNSSDHVTFTYLSNVQDGVSKFYKKDKAGFQEGYNSFNSTESATFSRMLTEYMTSKFVRIEPGADISIEIVLQDFWMELYTDDPAGFQLLMIGNSTTLYKATVNILVTVKNGDDEYKKIIQSSSEEELSISTNVYRQGEQWTTVVGRAINSANNKILMMLNSYLDELSL
jgi:hypothetical protein